MRTFITTLIVAAGLAGLAAPAHAAPAAPHELSTGRPGITDVRQRCGKGWHRQNGWQDKHGAWHGKCVPNPPKKNSPS